MKALNIIFIITKDYLNKLHKELILFINHPINKMRKPQKHYVVSLPPDTDMVKLRTKIKENSLIKGKTANALIAAYILKLAK